MRKMTGFLVSGLSLLALAAPASAAATGSVGGHHDDADEAVTAPTNGPDVTAPATYEPARHGYQGDRRDRDGRDRDGRWHHDRRYHYRDGRYYYRDGYYHGDDHYYRGRPTPDCPSGEWAYHPNTGWMCAG